MTKTKPASVSNAIARRLKSIRDKCAMRDFEVASLLGSRPETVSRWNLGHTYPLASPARILLELVFIVDQLSEFYEPREVRLWILSPQKHLRGLSPAEAIRAGRIDEVRGLVIQIGDAAGVKGMGESIVIHASDHLDHLRGFQVMRLPEFLHHFSGLPSPGPGGYRPVLGWPQPSRPNQAVRKQWAEPATVLRFQTRFPLGNAILPPRPPPGRLRFRILPLAHQLLSTILSC